MQVALVIAGVNYCRSWPLQVALTITGGFGHCRWLWPFQGLATAVLRHCRRCWSQPLQPGMPAKGTRVEPPSIWLAPSHSSPFPKAAAPKGVSPGVLEVPPLRVGKWEIDVSQARSSCHKSQPCAGGSGALQGCSYLYASFAPSRFIIDCGAALQRQPRLRWIVQDTKYK